MISPALKYQDLVLLSPLYSLLFYIRALLMGSKNFSKWRLWASILTNILLQTKGHIPCIFLSDGAPCRGEMAGRMLQGSKGLPYTALPLQPYHCCLFGTMSALPTIKIYSTGAGVKGQLSAWEHSLVRNEISLQRHFLKEGNSITSNYTWLIA